MNEFFRPFTRSGSSKVIIKNENCKGVLYFLLRAGLALGDPTNPSKGNARTTGNLLLWYSETDVKRTLADNYVSRTGTALLQSLLFISID